MKASTRLAMFLAAAAAAAPRPATARGPDPVVAALISTGATLIPLGVTTALWLGERGTDEGIRFDLGMVFLGVGAIVGPSTGQIYASGGGNAWVSFILRTITGAVGLTGAGLWARGETAGVRNAGRALAGVGGVPTGLLAIYDIWDSADSAVETQRRRGFGPSADLLLLPEAEGLSLCRALPAGMACPLATPPPPDAAPWPGLGFALLAPPAR